MEKRSQRYEEEMPEKPKTSRMSKNKYLYDEINNKIGYKEIENLDTQTRIDLSDLTNMGNSREEYQKTKDYQEFFETKKVDEVEKKEEPEKEKIYDINSILEEARKNRDKYDELERKRKLKGNDYASVADINKKEEYKKSNDIDEKELTDLINTITSHTLLNDIKKAEEDENDDTEEDLFSDLMSTNANIDLDGIAEEYTEKEKTEDEKIDNSFYTKSLDFSSEDFELSEELEREKDIKRKILIVIVTIAIIAVIGVVVWMGLKKYNIL